MGLNSDHALGREKSVFVNEESTVNTYAKPAGTDALKVLNSTFTYSTERKNREDARSTRSVLERIQGRETVVWSLEMYANPSGAAGTAPDCAPLFKSLFGVETTNASTSVVYTLSETQALPTLSIAEETSSVSMQSVSGAWVDEGTISQSGGDDAKISFSGGAMGAYLTGTSTLNGAISASDQVIVQTADQTNFEVGSVIQIGSDDNSGAGYEITAKTGATLTAETTLTASDADTVIPFVPTETTAGSPISGTLGDLTIDAVSLPITAYTVTIKNGSKPVDDEAFQSNVTDVLFSFREVSGEVTVRARKDQILNLSKSKNTQSTSRALLIDCGTTSGSILRISCPYIEVDSSGLEIPASDEAILKLPFTALGSSGGDEISVTWL